MGIATIGLIPRALLGDDPAPIHHTFQPPPSQPSAPGATPTPNGKAGAPSSGPENANQKAGGGTGPSEAPALLDEDEPRHRKIGGRPLRCGGSGRFRAGEEGIGAEAPYGAGDARAIRCRFVRRDANPRRFGESG